MLTFSLRRLNLPQDYERLASIMNAVLSESTTAEELISSRTRTLRMLKQFSLTD
ncbi:hypothetical protein [Paenibacillus apiarius]|uniref:hypothetical protein n=1 Tax=Paenibacillus apiarius TaxID=46240 RepID=UPI003B3B405B